MTRFDAQPPLELNAMTVDVEEHFQASVFETAVSRDSWEKLPSRVEANTHRLLDLLDQVGVLATFFVLGWIGERYPNLVRRMSDRGHEIASHGYSHRLVYDQSREQFHRETLRGRKILQELSGQPVNGYRAASFSIRRDNLWALDVLVEVGFTYDSSLFPVVHDRYGIPGAPRHIHRVVTPAGADLIEVPPSTVNVGGIVVPIAGGGYLRLLPGRISHWAIRRLNSRERVPAVVYVHPWEIDPDQPRIAIPWLAHVRHYSGLGTVEKKLRSLARAFRFGPVCRVLEEGPVPLVRESGAPDRAVSQTL